MDPTPSKGDLQGPKDGDQKPARVADEVIVTWLEESPKPGIFVPPSPSDVVELSPQSEIGHSRPIRRRRLTLPLILFGLTCISMFLAGIATWNPWELVSDNLMPLRRALLAHWQAGLVYTAAALAILMAHEMGHFVATVIHRIPATYPLFLPFPISPLGTLGAVIGMEGSRANRKEIFDIGLAGPIAGLVVAVPMFVLGLRQIDLSQHQFGGYQLDLPLAAHWLMQVCHTPGYQPGQTLWQAQLNPMIMAGWVGLFVTGLNMLPVSQLDGGHVIYTLFGRKSHWIARAFILAAISYMLFSMNFGFSVMIGLILFIGTDHPPTSDDSIPLGWFRTLLGLASLAIPVLCFPPRVIIQ